MSGSALLESIDAALPQTQCRRCGYDDCRAYAQAVARGEAINRCPPGGAEGVQRLARITGRAELAIDPQCGVESPRRVASIDEAACIGCTLCIQACPVDAIAGAPKRMHSVLADWCTGCELCLAPCPTDCIRMLALPGLEQATGWQAWSDEQAARARHRYLQRARRLSELPHQPAAARAVAERLQSDGVETSPAAVPEAGSLAGADTAAGGEADAAQARKRALVRAALERAQARQAARRTSENP